MTNPTNPGGWPDPTPEMLGTPLFEAVWQVIKSWDVNVPAAYDGYCGATGNHARAVLDGISAEIAAQVAAAVAQEREACAQAVLDQGNFRDLRRDELTDDFGKPRFDFMHSLVAAIRARGTP